MVEELLKRIINCRKQVHGVKDREKIKSKRQKIKRKRQTKIEIKKGKISRKSKRKMKNQKK